MLSGTGLGNLTDLYQLTMAGAYFREGRNERATFEMFVREMPPRRGYLIAAGLEDAVYYLTRVGFSPSETRYLRSLGRFDAEFLSMLEGFRFTGDLDAMPEGTVFFPSEPILRVTAPRIQGQLVETFLLNAVNFQILAATKAARAVEAAAGRPVVDFSLRRTHGGDAGLKVARASWMAGFAGTSNVLAGQYFGIPVVGTVAHSFIMSYLTEREAFSALARTHPQGAVFLLDTYDVDRALGEAIRVAREGAPKGFEFLGVRLDSGDLLAQSRRIRARLDAEGFPRARILVSGNLDEYAIARLVRARAPIDTFAVGTALGTSNDSPALGVNYKLVADEGGGGPRFTMKVSARKRTWPGAKQVWRFRKGRLFSRDVMGLAREAAGGRTPLLKPVMRNGRLVRPLPSLAAARRRCAAQLALLPSRYRRLERPERYPVSASPALRTEVRNILRLLGRRGA
jgi:nicotinate phosphoribosyltransferase